MENSFLVKTVQNLLGLVKLW